MIKKILLGLLLVGFTSNCVVIKEYEKVNINDKDMVLGASSIDRFQTNAQAYREAAVGANGGKTGGGCGCN